MGYSPWGHKELDVTEQLTVRNSAGRRSHPYRLLIRAFYWAVALGQNSRGRVSKEARWGLRSKGSLWGKGSLRSLRGVTGGEGVL